MGKTLPTEAQMEESLQWGDEGEKRKVSSIREGTWPEKGWKAKAPASGKVLTEQSYSPKQDQGVQAGQMDGA